MTTLEREILPPGKKHVIKQCYYPNIGWKEKGAYGIPAYERNVNKIREGGATKIEITYQRKGIPQTEIIEING